MARSKKNTRAKPIKPPSPGGACSKGLAPSYSEAFGGERNPTRARSKPVGAVFPQELASPLPWSNQLRNERTYQRSHKNK